jgi:hypothetical protein
MNDLRVLFDVAADTGYRAQLADAKGRRLGGGGGEERCPQTSLSTTL